MRIQASVLHGTEDIRLDERELMSPEANEVQVKVECTGLCGSDLHYYKHFRNGDILVREPLSLGHESAGTVAAIGSKVSGVSVGDRVALEVGVPCDQCERCRQGRYNICKDLRFRSSGKSYPHYQGTLQDRINHPAKWCHRLPDDISSELGALLEPLGVALHAFRRSNCPPKAQVLVFGAGAVGLLCAAVAKMNGAKTVVLADIDERRLDFALANRMADRKFLMTHTRSKDDAASLEDAQQIANEIGRIDDVELFDVVFECTGISLCTQAGIFASSSGGRLMLIGMGHPVQTLPLAAAALREVDIVGVFRYSNTYAEGIALLQQAAAARDGPDFSRIITHRVRGLESVPMAFELASRPVDGDGKLVLKVVVTATE